MEPIAHKCTPATCHTQQQTTSAATYVKVCVADAELAACKACADVRVHLGVNIGVDAQQHLHLLANLQQKPQQRRRCMSYERRMLLMADTPVPVQ